MKLFGGVRGRGSATGRQRPAETHPSRAEEPEQPLLRSQVSQQPFEKNIALLFLAVVNLI